MIDLGIAIVVFVLTAACHVLIHNAFVSRSRASIKTIAIFIPGFFALWLALILLHTQWFTYNTEMLNWWTAPLPRSSLIVFFVLSIFYILYYGSAFFGDESPSSKIYEFLRKKRTASYRDITRLFSDRELIHNRLNDLASVGIIEDIGDTYRIKRTGFWLIALIEQYRRFLGWESSG